MTIDNHSNEREILQFISQTHRSEFDRRRVYEWRVLLSTLTLYVLAIAGKLSGKLELLDITYFKYIIWAMFIGLAMVSIKYLTHIHTAHGINKYIAEIAENALMVRSGESALIEIQDSILENFSSSIDPKISVFKNNWAWRWQVITILSISIVTSIILTH